MSLRPSIELFRPLARLVPQPWVNRVRAQMIHLANRRAQRLLGRADEPESIISNWPCRLCGSAGVRVRIGSLGVTQDAPFLRASYDLIHCTSCESVSLDPLPLAEDLRLLYEDGVQFADPLYSDAINSHNLVSRYKRRFGKLGLYPSSGETLLEIGAGLAWVCRACKEVNAGIQTTAQDVSAECADACPWVDVYQVGPIETLRGALTASVISLTHVIEHVPDPTTTLTVLSNFLRPDGRFYITAPFRPALWKLDHGFEAWRRYSYTHVPAHLQYLSRRWFESWCDAHGFEITHWDDSQDGHQAFETVLTRSA